eukprot:746243_1
MGSRRNNNWFDDDDDEDFVPHVQDMNMDTSSQEGNFRDVLNRAAAAAVDVDGIEGANNGDGDANADNNNDVDGAEHSGNASTSGNVDEDEEVQDVTDQYVTSTSASTSRTSSRTNRNRGAGSGSGASATRLRDMFAAPTHLMHTNGAGGFAGARNMAKETKR